MSEFLVSRQTHQVGPLLKAATQLGFPAALWCLPDRPEVRLLVSFGHQTGERPADLDELPPSFVLHPFAGEPADTVRVMEGDLLLTFDREGTFRGLSGALGEDHPTVQKYLGAAAQLTAAAPAWRGLSGTWEPDPENEVRYKRIVGEAVASIQRGELAKVVLSRTKTIGLPEGFDPFQAFRRLCHTYPSAFVSLVHLPDRGEMWLGATPEIIVAVDAGGTFRTTSLAGTQSAYAGQQLIPARQVRWGQKEIQEQALVSRYIVDCFKKIRLREYAERGPRTARAGNLYHLKTDFEVDTRAVNFPELGTVMLSLLHPTSAVCGSPKAAALAFIEAAEGYDRSLYSGYLGPVNIAGETNLFVNLRTMRIADGVVTLFAGAGITEDSDPQEEWDETEMKCRTLLAVLR